MRTALQRIIIAFIIGTIILTGCSSKVGYGYPTEKLYAMNELTYQNIEDLVLFTYVPNLDYEKDRQTVVVNTKTKKQYNFDNQDTLREGFYEVTYLDNKMLIPDGAENFYVLYNKGDKKGIFQQIFQASDGKSILAIDAKKNLLIANNTKQHEISKIDLDGLVVSTFSYPEIGEFDEENGDLLGRYSFNLELNKLLFYGKSGKKENQLFAFDETRKQWEHIFSLEEATAYVPSLSLTNKKYFILVTPDDNQLYFVDLVSNKAMQKEAPFALSYDVRINRGQLEGLHDNQMLFSAVNLDPNNFKVNESYAFAQLIPEGVQRVNHINLNSPKELIFMTGDGLYVYDKNTKVVENIIYMEPPKAPEA